METGEEEGVRRGGLRRKAATHRWRRGENKWRHTSVLNSWKPVTLKSVAGLPPSEML